MIKIKRAFLFLFFCSAVFISKAQQKYALLVGINNYYDWPGVVNDHSLHGCVNDANSMKALLINRFGYNGANIQTIFDADASKKNVVAALMAMVDKCKPGDAFVFYFSGHGVWAWDLDNTSDPIKKGMNQAMVMSDLYSESLGCLLTDAMIKKIFNKFVDKKVILTSIFDCCFSGNLPMDIIPFGHNIYTWISSDYATEKSMPLQSIPFIQDGNTYGTGDAMQAGKGLPDELDYRVYNELYEADDTAMSKEIAYVFEHPNDSLTLTRSFNLKDAIRIFDPENIPRPSDRLHSQFLSLSATTDVEKGLEITDKYGNHHGAFTNALLTVYKNNPADIPLSQLTASIQAEMKKQHYNQSPTFHFEASRLNGNLLGITPTGFSNNITAKCTAVKGNLVTLDMGSIAGLEKGNYFKDLNAAETFIIQLDSTGQYNAFGKIIKGTVAAVKAGHFFTLTNSYAKTTPFVKIYIPAAVLTNAAFNDFFKQKIERLVRSGYYEDLMNFDNSQQVATFNLVYTDAVHVNKVELKEVSSPKNIYPYFVFLPIPTYIAGAISSVLSKNPNVQLVNSADKANFILCLNYIKGGGENTGGFVFSLQNFLLVAENSMGYPVYPWFTDIKDLNIKGAALTKIASNINDMANTAARAIAGSKWLN